MLMPVKSYLAFPHPGKKGDLESALIALLKCDVIPSKNIDILVVVTDTQNEKEEEDLLNKINNIESLDHLTLVSGFSDTYSPLNEN